MKISTTNISKLAMLIAFACTASTALANQTIGTASVPNTVQIGNISAPYTVSYGNSFFAPTLEKFYDNYIFTLSPAASFNSITASINLGTFFGTNNISARLYQGSGPFSSGVTPLIQAWSTPFSATPGLTGSTTFLSLPTLLADSYTLQIRGDVVGVAGGSYAGIMNVSPIPEPATYALMLAGLGLIGFAMYRKSRAT